MASTTTVWNANMVAVYQLSDTETLTGTYIGLHPLGALLLDPTLDPSTVVATTDSDQPDVPRVYQRLQSVTKGTCQCGNPYVKATWTTV